MFSVGQVFRACLLALTLISATPVLAQDTRTVDVRFPRGTSGTTINDSLTGYETINYRLGVSAGQRMDVTLDTDNASSYFNITAPGASEALYNSSISGNGTSVVIPSSGNYTISVYLMRNAARRNETANFELTLYVESAAASAPRQVPVAPAANPSSGAVSTDLMPRFCAGEASAKYSIRPQAITTNLAFKSGNNYVVQGYFDGNDGTTFFNCYFDLGGNFA